jgi:hypothetical protein
MKGPTMTDVKVLTPAVAKASGYMENYLVLVETPTNLYRLYCNTFEQAKTLAYSYSDFVRFL